MLNFRSPSNNVQIIKISGLEGAQGSLERQHRSVTKVTLRGEGGGAREPVTSVTTGTRNIGAKRRANSFAAVTTSTSVSLIRAPSIEKRLEDTERSRASQFCKFNWIDQKSDKTLRRDPSFIISHHHYCKEVVIHIQLFQTWGSKSTYCENSYWPGKCGQGE